MIKDTIAAIATGLTAAGISIIRISGPEAFQIASGIFRIGNREKLHRPDMDTWQSHTVHYGYIVENERPVDEVMLLYMQAPRTFTREDTVEIDCHGGIVVTKKILSLVLRSGARLAEPGEFTRRAFLNGKMDLTAAEAVADIIDAESPLAVRNAAGQLGKATDFTLTAGALSIPEGVSQRAQWLYLDGAAKPAPRGIYGALDNTAVSPAFRTARITGLGTLNVVGDGKGLALVFR